MYIPTDNNLSPGLPTPHHLAPAISATATALARQFTSVAWPSPINAVAGPSYTSAHLVGGASSPAGSIKLPHSDKWYTTAAWIVPVAWALIFYCVLSMLMLCTLYGQGVVDGKLNYIPRHLRHQGPPLPSYHHRHAAFRSTSASPGDQWQTDTLIDSDDEGLGAGHSHHNSRAEGYLSGGGNHPANTVFSGHTRNRVDHTLFLQQARREEVARGLQRQVVVEYEQEAGFGGGRHASEDGRHRMDSRQVQSEARRSEVVRVERALTAAGVL